ADPRSVPSNRNLAVWGHNGAVTAASKPSAGSIITGEAVLLDLRVARLGSRALALLLDLLVQLILFFLLSSGVGGLIGIASAGGSSSGEAVLLALRVARLGSRAPALLLDLLVQLILFFLLSSGVGVLIAIAYAAGVADPALYNALMILTVALVLIGYPTAMH